MLFYTQQFLVFFGAVFVLYWAMPWPRVRVWLLTIASFYFYMSWNAQLAALIAFSAVLDFYLARRIEAARTVGGRKAVLLLSIIWNVGQLAYFKYANFFLDSAGHFFSTIGISTSLPVLSVILPIGVSFYTFEAISYTVDVYRGDIPAEKKLINFVLFISFFPRLIAGPIIRGRNFLPQIDRLKRWDWARLQLAANYFLRGLFKKVVIADRMAAFADPVFAIPANYGTGVTWIGLLAYTIQIYCDFSGYSDMAVGLGHALGYKLPQNFRMPYLAANIADFWSRWHISLTSWLRDYIFIPLGGTRCGPIRAAWNVVITMALCGLWHGAQWHFVLFGLIQAALLLIHRQFAIYCRSHPALDRLLQTGPGVLARVALTFLTFILTLVVFRSPSFSDTITIYRRLADFSLGFGTAQPLSIFWWLAALAVAAHLFKRSGWGKELWLRSTPPARAFGYATVLTLALLLSPSAGKAFIYFQF